MATSPRALHYRNISMLTGIFFRPHWTWYGLRWLFALPKSYSSLMLGKRGTNKHHLQTIIATAIPHITDEFHSLNQVGWYASALFTTVAATQSAWGKAFKYFSIKLVFLLSIVVFELGSLICGKALHLALLVSWDPDYLHRSCPK